MISIKLLRAGMFFLSWSSGALFTKYEQSHDNMLSLSPLLRHFYTPPKLCGGYTVQRARKRRITRIGTQVFPLGRMIFARRESHVCFFLVGTH